MNKQSLSEISSQLEMPICIQQAQILRKNNSNRKIYFISMPHLQTNKHRFRTYSKPISKIISL